VHDLVAVDDDEVIDAVRRLASRGLWVEPTGALAVAAAARHQFPGPVVCIASGRNISPPDLAALLA
jgi:threonine dehydratase